MPVITCDFETFWSSKDYTLSKIGPIQYIRDPKFHAQLLGWRVDKGPVQVCEHEDIPAVLAALHLDDPNNITVAHNGNGFDFLILSEIYNLVPANTLDTIDMMRWVGLSSVIGESHASLTAHLKTGTKRQGTVISDGKHWPQDFTPEEREAFKLYCKQDVYQCSENCFRLLPLITEDMLKFDTLTMRMACDPKLMVDVSALREYDAQLQAQVEKSRQDLMHLFHFQNAEEFQKSIRSADKFCAMLRQLGAEPPMKLSEKKSETKKAKLEAEGFDTSDPASWEVYTPALSKQDREFVEMQECGDERVELLVRTRLENNSSIQQSRVKTFLKMGEYWKPVPVLLKAFGAHTGRYAAGSTEGKSEGLNFQNLSKRNPAMLPLRQAIKVPAGYKLVSCDSSQVEARVLAYVANQTDMLQLFAQREDVYADFGEIISGGIPAKEIHDGAKSGDKKLKKIRNNAKTIILGAGYGTSPAKAAHTMWMQGQKQDDDYSKHAEIVKSYIQMYRQKNSAITYFWKVCQGVIENLAMGGSGSFGGPDNTLFRYGSALLPELDTPVPSIWLPNGYALRYPGLAVGMNDNGKAEYTYKLRRGKVDVPHRLYGSALTENCIAKGTEVLTDSGWKPIETIGLSDLIYDGVDFVNHQGIVSKGLQICVELNGVFMTPDHEVLTMEDSNGTMRLVDPFRKDAPQFQGYNRAEVWRTDSNSSYPFRKREMDLGVSLLMRQYIRTQGSRCDEKFACWGHSTMPCLQSQSYIKATENTWNDWDSYLQCMAFDAFTLRNAYLSCVQSLWRAWDKSMRTLAYIRELLHRYVSNISTRFSARQNRQRWGLLPRELSLDYLQKQCAKQSKRVFGSGCESIISGIRNKPINNSLQNKTWMAAGAFIRQAELQNARSKREAQIRKEVFDIMGCGPRHRFVVKGDSAFIVHNCTQSLAFALLIYQACRMSDAGIKLCCNIHDSFSTVVEERAAEDTAIDMIDIMRTLPPWLAGCPIDAEAEITDDFTGA